MTARPGATDIGASVIKKVAWRLMPLIMVCYLFAFFDRINISFAKFQLQAALGLSDTAYGLGASLFVIGALSLICAALVLFALPQTLRDAEASATATGGGADASASGENRRQEIGSASLN